MPPNSFSFPTNPQLPPSPPSDSDINKVVFAAYSTAQYYQTIYSVSAIRGMKRARDGYGEEEDSRQYHANGTYWLPEQQEAAIEMTEREIKKLRVSNASWDTENGNAQPTESQQIALQQHQYQNHTNNHLTHPPTFSIQQDQQAQAYSHNLAQSQSYRHAQSNINAYEAYPQHMQNPYLTQVQSPMILDKLQPFRISTRGATQNQPYQTPSPPPPPSLSEAVANTYGNINQVLFEVHVARHGDPEQNERWWENETTGASGGQSNGNPQVASSSASASSTLTTSAALPVAEQYNGINSLLREAFLQRQGRLPG